MQILQITITKQHAKKVLSDSLGLVNFAIGLSSVLKLPDGQTMFYREFKLQKNYCNQTSSPKIGFCAGWSGFWARKC